MAQGLGLTAEQRAVDVLIGDGWRILGRRLRTSAGEIDLVARCGPDGKAGIVVFVEVKARARLADAAASIGPRQRIRLLGAAEILIARYPEWAAGAVRFDVILVDARGTVRRIADAFRAED